MNSECCAKSVRVKKAGITIVHISAMVRGCSVTSRDPMAAVAAIASCEPLGVTLSASSVQGQK